MSEDQKFSKALNKLITLVWVLLISVVGLTFLNLSRPPLMEDHDIDQTTKTNSATDKELTPVNTENIWQAPDTSSIPNNEEGKLIRYGRELIVHTSVYLGPKGKVRQISNGMNCQNCHLEAGTKPFANNFGAVRTEYPKLRKRSGIYETFEYRVNGCFQRSMNGQKLEEDSREMKAIVSYLKWVGKGVSKEESPYGFGMPELPFLDRPASPVNGKKVYMTYCQTCHGTDGEGYMNPNGLEYIYPPLYGKNSYNQGAGIYRLTQFAEYVKNNMPYGVNFSNPVLSDEEAWDVAAYVNSMPRPAMDLSDDWANIADKPYDHPFGPYADGFTEEQHKYGPFATIINTKIQ